MPEQKMDPDPIAFAPMLAHIVTSTPHACLIFNLKLLTELKSSPKKSHNVRSVDDLNPYPSQFIS